MADEAQQIRSINWREVFPFTHLFKAFRVAVHPSKLVLALVALLLIYGGGRILDGVWLKKHLVQPTDAMHMPDSSDNAAIERAARSGDSERLAAAMRMAMREGGDADSMGMAADSDARNPRGIFITFFDHQVNHVNHVIDSALDLNPRAIHAGAKGFLVTGPGWLLKKHPLFFTLFAIWFLLIWSVFGGAIARIAAVHVARDEKISVRQALRFSTNKLLSFAFAPLIPVIILLVIGAVLGIGGLLLYIPFAGPIVLSLVFFLALIAGLVMALVLLGLLGGFNLMYPTIAVEGSDSFDAISRSFSYVFARPWRMLFYTLVAIVYGALTYTFVRFFIWLVLILTHFFVGWFLGGQPETHWFGLNNQAEMWPIPEMDSLPYNVDHDGLKWSESFAAGMISFWVYLVIGLLGAYAISFYFSANTIIYYLMRREVDATELDDVYVEETEDDFGETSAATAKPGDPLGGGDGGVAVPAPATGSTSAPGGGISGTAGSSDPGGGGAVKAYDAPATEEPRNPPGDETIPGAPQAPPA